MIKSVTVTNYLDQSITLELTRPELSGFIITNIDGLGPVNATINTTELATTDGALFNSARISTRNIVLSVRYLGTLIEDVRQLSYKYFPVKKKVNLVIETDNRSLSIDGYVESNEPNIFSKEESADISIVCAFPYFNAANHVQTTIFSGVEPQFEFPFSNESLTEPLLNMGEIITLEYNNIEYDGDVETGMTISIHATGTVTGLSIYNVDTRESMKIDTDKLEALTGDVIIASDDIIICTEKGNKSVTLIRDGESINILNCLDKGSVWFQLSKGDNIIGYTAETGTSNLQFKIENKVLYEGI